MKQLYSQFYPGPEIEVGVPIVLLHGLFGNGYNWQRLAKRLSEYTSVYALDLPLHGRSTDYHLAENQTFYSAMAVAVSDWLTHNGLGRVHVVGHSMGGKIGIQLATFRPEAFATFTCIDIAPVRYAPSHIRIFEALRTVAHDIHTRTVLDQYLHTYIPDAMQRGFFLKQALFSESGLSWAFDVDTLYKRYNDILAAPVITAPITLPSLLIAGEKSEYMHLEAVAAFQRVFPDSQVVWLPTGHWVHAQDPEGVLRAVVGVLKDKE